MVKISDLGRRLRGFADLVLSSNCALCERTADADFCRDCQRQVWACGFAAAEQVRQAELLMFARGKYNGALKRAIAAFKYNNHPSLARPLAEWMATAWNLNPPALPLTVVPIPMHPDKLAKRGYNQAELLAEHFCDLTNLPLARHGLQRQRETEAQFGLTAASREQNLTNAFGLGKTFERRLPKPSVLLLDDIYTTGATVRSAAQTLRRHGIRVWGIAVLARAEMDQAQATKSRQPKVRNRAIEP